jgi:hypothetical protein
MTRIFRYCRWHDLERMLKAGWFISADLGAPHSHYSVLVEFLCCCGREPE